MTATVTRTGARGLRAKLAAGVVLGRLVNAGDGDVQQIPIQQLLASVVNAAAINYADNETPNGTIDGGNKSFALAHTPKPAGSLILVLESAAGQGLVQIQGVDYSLAGATVTYTTAPALASVHRAWYRY